LLASSYHWSPEEIDRLPARTRNTHLSMIAYDSQKLDEQMKKH